MNDDLDPNPHDDPTSPRPLPRNDSVRFTLNEAYAPTPAPPIQQLPSSLGTHTSTSSTSLKDVSQSSEDVSDASQTIREASKLPPDKQLQDGEDTYRMRHGWDSQYSAEQLQELSKNFYLYFNDKRHERRALPKAAASNGDVVALDWRMRDRLKTVFAALCLCLNIGVDPPDVLKTNPAARLECWIDPPSATSPTGENIAMDQIAKRLETQYQQLSLRTKYKSLTDPSHDEIKKICVSVRKNAKEERILFHYNGHGVPKPTSSGEIWVFNKDYTQYIPVPLNDLQSWIGAPSLFVWDASQAGLILKNFQNFVEKREHEHEMALKRDPTTQVRSYRDTIHLAACREDELLPTTPEIPADLFTCCLTTPIEIAVRQFMLRNPLKTDLTEEDLARIPGKAQERRTPIGELNWIFTAITDTIAWNCLPRPLFKKLFRQDLMVAALFRNFLLAQRIMRAFHCHPMSDPPLPSTHNHPLWDSWDLAVELVLIQLKDLRKNENRSERVYEYQHSDFFAQQLTAFSLYLDDGAPQRKEPEQLPIVLQVLLSQVHRVRALVLLARFLDFGPWAVNLALSIGIFPYVLKLLQSQAQELKPSLVFIWTRILAVDQSCQIDLHKDTGYQYFIALLRPEAVLPSRQLSEHRAMCCFILAMFCRDNRTTRQAALNSDLLPFCLKYVSIYDSENPLLRQWSCLCLSTLWEDFPDAKWAVIQARGHLKLCDLALDPVPEVRTAMLTALTTWLGVPDLAGDVQLVESFVIMKLLPMCDDGSSVVRKELTICLSVFVELYKDKFVTVACEQIRADIKKMLRGVTRNTGHDFLNPHLAGSDDGSLSDTPDGSEPSSSLKSYREKEGVWSRQATNGSDDSIQVNGKHARFVNGDGTADYRPSHQQVNGIKHASTPEMGRFPASRPTESTLSTIWKHVQYLSTDPDPEVSRNAYTIVDSVEQQALGEDEETNALLNLFSNLKHLSGMVEVHNSSTKGSGHHSRQLSFASAGGDISSLRRDGSRLSDISTLDSTPPTATFTAPPTRSVSRAASISASASDPQQLARNMDYLDLGLHGQDTPSQRAPAQQQARFHPSLQVNGYHSAEGSHQIKSGFFDWAKEFFTEPQMQAAELDEPGSNEYDERNTRRAKNEAILDRTQIMKDEAGSSRWDRPYGHFDNTRQPILMVAHQYEDHLAVADKANHIRIWNWSKQTRLHSFHNGNPYGSKVTGMKYVNEDDPHALLLVGSNDGAVKLYADYWSQEDCNAAAAFRGSSDSKPRQGSGNLVFDWIQTRGQLLLVGDSKGVQVWDVATELVAQDIPLGTSSLCTSLTTDQVEGNNIAAGFLDGSVRVYDQRIGSGRHVIKQWHEHTFPIVNVHLQRGGQRELVSGSTDGIVKMWDIRMQKSLLSVQAVKHGLTRLAVHEHAPVFAAGSNRGTIKVHSMTGTELSSFAPAPSARAAAVNLVSSTSYSTIGTSHIHQTGPPVLGARAHTLPPVAALSFHPHRMLLAAACVGDTHVSLFTCNEDKFKLDEGIWLNRRHRTGFVPGSVAEGKNGIGAGIAGTGRWKVPGTW